MTRQAETKAAASYPVAAAAIWGATLPIPAGPGFGDDFEVRVEAAWRHLKTAYFAAEEHDRLREVLAARIEVESVVSGGEGQTT